ncbi:MAG: NAD-dependent epimerase/dehydratase family protein [Proteobacteria bacterium]|nr:NAD-dependent epimerase/dehydratase family protein [Pseudomonadota bacterium]
MLNQTDHYRGKAILVTGSAGFIGSALVKALSEVDCDLICLKTGNRKIEVAPENKARITIRNGDIRSPVIWNELLDGVDVIFHFAAQTSSKFANDNPVDDMEINLAPVVRFIDTCQKKGVRPDIIFSGTVTQTGLTTDYPVDEQRRDAPITVYDINKLAQEKYLQYYGLEMGGRSVTLRLTNVYGPGARSSRADRGILNLMATRALAGQPLTIYGDGNYIRDYIFIDDVVSAFLAAGTTLPVLNGKYYVLGSGKGHSIKTMAETVRDLAAKIADKHVKIKHVPAPPDLSRIEFRHFVADTHNFRIASGWKPEFSLYEGVRRTIQFFRDLNSAGFRSNDKR